MTTRQQIAIQSLIQPPTRHYSRSYTFAGEIFHDVLHSQSWKSEHFDSCKYRLADEMLGTFLFHRLEKPMNANVDFLRKLRQMAHFLGDALALQTSEDKEQCIKTLCSMMVPPIGKYTLVTIITGGSMNGHRTESTLMDGCNTLSLLDKLVAAVSVHSSELIRDILQKLSFQMTTDRCFRNSPLQIAVRQRSVASVRIILQAVSRSYIKTNTKFLFGEYLIAEVVEAIGVALSCSSSEVLQALLDYHDRNLHRVHKSDYVSWLQNALEVDDTSMLKALLGMKFAGTLRVTREALIALIFHGGPQHVMLLLSTDNLDVNRAFHDTSPLVAAVRSGRPEMVKTMLDAGAEVDMRVGPSHDRRCALQILLHARIAFENKVTIMRLLLDHGAGFSTIDRLPCTKALVKMLEDEAIRRRTNATNQL